MESLKPTYRLLIGVPGRSNAFAISEKLGIETEVINRAKELVSAENIRFEDVVDTLEERRLEMEKERQLAEKLRLENELLKKKTQERLDEIEKLRDKEIQRARSEAMRLVENSRREANALMMEIEQMKKALKNQNSADKLNEMRSKVRKGLSGVDAAADPVIDGTDDRYELSRPLQVGDNVRIAGMGSEGKVLSLPDNKNYVEIQTGSMKMRVKVSDLRLIEKKKEQKKTSFVKNNTESRLNASADTRCDLRGMTVEEGIMTLDLFIDSMVMAGLSEFTIIHGKGTGVLRAAVQQHLKKHSQIKTYRLGTFGEGENGVTIATIK